MSLTINTTTPKGLLSAIKKEIEENKIRTWSNDLAGNFTHTPDQWENKASLKPTLGIGKLSISIIKPTNATVLSKAVKGVYYGRFIEMICTHFDGRFTSINCTV